MDYDSESSYTSQISYSPQGKGLINKLKTCLQPPQCDLKLYLQYQDNQLTISWDFNEINIKSGVFSRHLIIFDIEQNTLFDQHFIFQKFYKSIALGDFLRVYNTKMDSKRGWIQKTLSNPKINFNTFKDQETSLLQQLEKCFIKSKKFSQPVTISIFSTNIKNRQILKEIVKRKKNHKFHYVLNLFYLENNFQHIYLNLVELEQHLDFYFCQNLKNVQENITCYIYNLSKIKVMNNQIKLICLDGQIVLPDKNNSNWRIKKGVLKKNLYALSNKLKYVQVLLIKSCKKQKLKFQVQFEFQLVSNVKYSMSKMFQIEVQNSTGLNKMFWTYNSRIHKNQKYYSIMEKQVSLPRFTNRQTIIIRESLPKVQQGYQQGINIDYSHKHN